MKFIFSTLFFACLAATSFAQEKWYRNPTPAGIFMAGAGPTFLGVSAKAGVFTKGNILLGFNGELHELLSSRREAGVFGRKYLNSNRLSFFVQAGVAYGRFQIWDFAALDIDKPNTETPELHRGVKLNGSLGGEIRISRMVSIEGEAGYGRIFNANWWAPSIRSAINIRLK